MNYKILGLSKTNHNFINKISKISNDINSLKDNLSQLNIFTNIKSYKNNVMLQEIKNKISINSKGKDKNFLSINFVNMLGNAENLNINFESFKEYEIIFKKPFIISNVLLFFNFKNKRSGKSINEIEISNKKVSIGYGFDKYMFMKINLPFFNFNLKQGLFNNTYTRIENSLERYIKVYKNINYKMQCNTGVIINNIKDELFRINIKGYDKNIGKSYMEVNNKIIYKFKNINMYLYSSIGYTYKKSSLYEDIGLFIYNSITGYNQNDEFNVGRDNESNTSRKDRYLKEKISRNKENTPKVDKENIPKNKENTPRVDRSDNVSLYGIFNNINKKGILNTSLGTGINIPFTNQNGSPSLDISIGFPLINNKKTFDFSFGIDF